MTSRRGVIFDMDGVLLLSTAAHWTAWSQVAGSHGVHLTRAQFHGWHGLTNPDICAQLLGARATPALVAAVADAKERAFRAAIGRNVPLAPGARELLAALRQAGVAIALGSSAPIENVDLVLDGGGIREHFDAIVHAGMVARGKPAPDVFLRALSLLGLPRERCVVVEDAPAGVQAARAAGIEVVGIASNHDAEALRAAGAGRVAASLAGLPRHWLLA